MKEGPGSFWPDGHIGLGWKCISSSWSRPAYGVAQVARDTDRYSFWFGADQTLSWDTQERGPMPTGELRDCEVLGYVWVEGVWSQRPCGLCVWRGWWTRCLVGRGESQWRGYSWRLFAREEYIPRTVDGLVILWRRARSRQHAHTSQELFADGCVCDERPPTHKCMKYIGNRGWEPCITHTFYPSWYICGAYHGVTVCLREHDTMWRMRRWFSYCSGTFNAPGKILLCRAYSRGLVGVDFIQCSTDVVELLVSYITYSGDKT